MKSFRILLVVVALALAALGCNFTSTSGLPPVGVPSNTPGAGSTVEIVSVSTVQSVSPTPEPTQTARVETQVVVVTATSESTKVPTKAALVAQNDLASTPEPTEEVEATNPVTATDTVSDVLGNLTVTVSGTVQAPVTTTVQGAWTVFEFERWADNPIIAAWIGRLKDPAPEMWKTYPNVPNPDVPDFRVVNGDEVPDGVEYGVANVPFCQQDTRCDFVVPGWHYRLITADYKFLGMECKNEDAENRHGCLLLLVNEGNETYIWRDQNADNGFTVAGRYWNGDALEWGVWGLVSHASANMLNMETYGLLDEVLNAGPNGANAGANCGVQPVACGTVDVTVVVHTGDAIVAILHTTVVHP